MLISEASRRSGVSARMLRHYDALGLVRPSGRTANGYRDYSEGDLRRLLHVEALRALGMSLQQVGDALRPAASEAAPGALVRELIARSRERLAAERALLARLEQLDGIGPADWGEALDAVRLARGLGSDDPLARQRAAIELGAAPVGDPAAAAGPGALAEALLAEAEPNAAGALRWALVRAAPGPEVLADALLDPRLPRRTRAVEAIAAFGAPGATPLLLRALRDPVAEVRAAAALALGPHGDERAERELLALVAEGPRDVAAAEVLGELGALSAARAHRILAGYRERLADPATNAAARSRLTQGLGELRGAFGDGAPAGPSADPHGADPLRTLLAELARDADRAVARVASYLLAS